MSKNENLKVTGIYSKFWRITLVIVAMLLIFVGPTYVPYVLANILKKNYYISALGVGPVLFVAGMALMLFLIRKKLITV
jgi:hypothetical protein